MKIAVFAAAVFACVASSGSAYAERWVQPVNGTVSAVTMPDGDLMMKIALPAQEFQIVSREMKRNLNTCVIKEIYPDSPNTMVLICGVAGSTVQ
jgi:hypothetical protein